MKDGSTCHFCQGLLEPTPHEPTSIKTTPRTMTCGAGIGDQASTMPQQHHKHSQLGMLVLDGEAQVSQNKSGGSKPLSFGTELIAGHLGTSLATSRQQNLSILSFFSIDNSPHSTPISSGNLSGIPPLDSTVPPASPTVPHFLFPSLLSPLALVPSSIQMPPHDSHIPDHGFMAVFYANNHTLNYKERCFPTNGDCPPHLQIQVTAAGYMFHPPGVLRETCFTQKHEF